MSSSESFPSLVGTVHTGSMPDASGIVASDWYTPGSYSYNEPYITQYPTSTIDTHAWSTYARASIPDLSATSYALAQPNYAVPIVPSQVRDPSRPRSSPSTFGPGTEHMTWPTSTALGIYSGLAYTGQPTPPTTSTFPPSVFQQAYASDSPYPASTPPEIKQPVPKRPFPTIAPNPEQMAAQKRKREEEEQQQQEGVLSSSKKRKRASSVASADLSEDDRFLVQLKEDESLPWKDIANRFQTDKGKSFQVAALQMRYKRLREKFRTWMDEDVKALKQAHEYWEKYKWEIIAQRMLDYGVAERWPARHCARKWQELEMNAAALAVSGGMSQGLSHFASPVTVEAPSHFTFMPMH